MIAVSYICSTSAQWPRLRELRSWERPQSTIWPTKRRAAAAAVSVTPKSQGLPIFQAGWWFGTFFIFPYIGNNHPNWLIFFRGVETTNHPSYGWSKKSCNIWLRFMLRYGIYFVRTAGLSTLWHEWGMCWHILDISIQPSDIWATIIRQNHEGLNDWFQYVSIDCFSDLSFSNSIAQNGFNWCVKW